MNWRAFNRRPLRYIQQHFRNRITAADKVRLHYRRIYILPTRRGCVFALMLLIMLVGSINYGNNLAFMLTFLLTGIFLVCIIHTFRNLLDLRFSVGKIQAVFCGEALRIPLQISNLSGHPRYAVRIRADQQDSVCDIGVNSQCALEVPQSTDRRGRFPIKQLTVSSTFPLGLFRAWSYVALDATYIAYPKIVGEQALPADVVGMRQSSGNAVKGSDDFMGLRNYNIGDTLRHVHWKAVARGQGLFTKQFGGEAVGELWLNWQDVRNTDQEVKLSQLAKWLLAAESMRIKYGLRLPGKTTALNTGKPHLHECLRRLALFGVGA